MNGSIIDQIEADAERKEEKRYGNGIKSKKQRFCMGSRIHIKSPTIGSLRRLNKTMWKTSTQRRNERERCGCSISGADSMRIDPLISSSPFYLSLLLCFSLLFPSSRFLSPLIALSLSLSLSSTLLDHQRTSNICRERCVYGWVWGVVNLHSLVRSAFDAFGGGWQRLLWWGPPHSCVATLFLVILTWFFKMMWSCEWVRGRD